MLLARLQESLADGRRRPLPGRVHALTSSSEAAVVDLAQRSGSCSSASAAAATILHSLHLALPSWSSWCEGADGASRPVLLVGRHQLGASEEATAAARGVLAALRAGHVPKGVNADCLTRRKRASAGQWSSAAEASRGAD
jgi:hypothetical protein